MKLAFLLLLLFIHVDRNSTTRVLATRVLSYSNLLLKRCMYQVNHWNVLMHWAGHPFCWPPSFVTSLLSLVTKKCGFYRLIL